MGKFDGVLLVTDYDDTYCPESGVIPQANLDAAEYFKANGGIFTIATGRAHRTFAPFLSLAPVNAPVILSNGAQLFDFARGEMLLSVALPPSAAGDMEELFRLEPRLGLEAYHNDEVYVHNPNPWIRYHLEKAGTAAEERPISRIPQPWDKAILENDNDILLPIQRRILRHWGDRYEAIFSNSHMLEITAKGANKGGMVLELVRRLGIARENLYCVGDNQNDIPMLAVSAIPFAPADCAQAVKDAGVTLLPSCEEGAIAAVIGILDRRY